MKVTRDAVLVAIAECDALGVDAFLAKYGFGRPTSFLLQHNGKSYPSKAVLGVAAGLKARDFSGGAAHVGKILAKLGFRCRGLGRALAAMFLAAAALGYKGVPAVEINNGPVANFASGANHAGEILGFAKVGHDVGMAANKLRAGAEAAALRLAGTDVQVFLDSGAFSEVDPVTLAIVNPISHEEWTKRLALAKRLATVLGDQLHVVAPDRVGSQADTLARLTRYAADVRDLRALGARVLVAMQRGELSRVDFAKQVDQVLGFSDWIPAMPMKKAAMSPAEVEAFVTDRQPTHLHLLGLGATNPVAAETFAAIHRAAPNCLFTCDSNLLRANVGLTNGPGGGPRRFTAALRVLPKIFGRFTRWSGVRRKKAAVALAFGICAWQRAQGAPAAPVAVVTTVQPKQAVFNWRREAAKKAWVTIRARRAAVTS